jgi:hypothetical protein
MDSGIIVQLFLGVLWALGCALFVTFLLEFRDDRSAHPSYPDRVPAAKAALVKPASVKPTSPKPESAKPASNTGTREIGSVTIAAENSANPSNRNSSASAGPLYAKANQGNAG